MRRRVAILALGLLSAGCVSPCSDHPTQHSAAAWLFFPILPSMASNPQCDGVCCVGEDRTPCECCCSPSCSCWAHPYHVTPPVDAP